jgi:hypothetical protein
MMYIFNHLPKCAGLSYLKLLRDIYGDDAVVHISLHDDVDYSVDAQSYQKHRIIMGHFGVRWNEVLAPGRRWLTALREPVDRVVSTYFFWRNNVPGSPDVPYLHLAQTLPLDEFVQSDHYLVRQGIHNAQTWQLADDLRVRYRSVSENDALEVAKANLAKFAFVGLYESFPESVARLCDYLGVSTPRALPRENTTNWRQSVSELSPRIVEAVQERNAADIALYEYAKTLARRSETHLRRVPENGQGSATTHLDSVSREHMPMQTGGRNADEPNPVELPGKSTGEEWGEWHAPEAEYRWTATCDAGISLMLDTCEHVEVDVFSGYPGTYSVDVCLDGLSVGHFEFLGPGEAAGHFRPSNPGAGTTRLSFRVPWLWQPSVHIGGSLDRRSLGIAVRSIKIV